MRRTVEIPGPPENLALTQDIACFIALKAREYNAKVPPLEDDPASNATDGDMAEILTDSPDDATQQELADAIAGLNDDQRHELVALTWIGRGDYTAASWNDAVKTACEQDSGEAVDYLMGMPDLSDLLSEGLHEIGLSCTAMDIANSGAPNPRRGIE
jgi:hypothetical protein